MTKILVSIPDLHVTETVHTTISTITKGKTTSQITFASSPGVTVDIDTVLVVGYTLSTGTAVTLAAVGGENKGQYSLEIQTSGDTAPSVPVKPSKSKTKPSSPRAGSRLSNVLD